MRLLAAIALSLILAAPAFAFEEPARGTALRAELMDTIRRLAEERLNPPIEFVVSELRHEDSVAFGSLRPQRPGGGGIAWDETQLAAEGENPEWYDGYAIHVLFRSVGDVWMVADWSIGASDVWWSDPSYCGEFAAVIPETCS